MENAEKNSRKLQTIPSLQKDLSELGVKENAVILVHSSLSKIGWVNGGAVGLIDALINTVTASGTIVMPTQSADWSEPSHWQAPPVPEEWWTEIRATMPPYNSVHTPTRGMGVIPEVFRKYEGVQRSAHPAVSFAAYGKYQDEILNDQSLDFGLGEQSPLARLYDLDAQILFVGTTYETNTAFHLGEMRAKTGKVIIEGARILEDGQSVWKEYETIDFEDGNFEQMGVQFEKEFLVRQNQIGQANSKLFSLRDAVDFAKAYYEKQDT